jgi:mycofactocin system glycosyltransferase
VTVVVPVRDRADGLAATLSTLGEVAEVLVIDDGSLDPSATGMVAARRRARLIRHAVPAGPAAARNTGWNAARTELIAFVDADCQPASGWLSTLLPHFADPAVGAVAPRIVTGRTDGPPSLAAYERGRSALDLGRREGPVRPGSVVAYVPTATLIVRASALADVSGFDEALRYGEDVDLVWRLVKRGWRVRYEPATTSTHPMRNGFRLWLRQRHQYGSSAAPLAFRHHRAVAPASVRIGSALAWALVAAGRPASAAAVATASSAALAGRAGWNDWDAPTAMTLARLALAGHIRAGADIATAIRRAWLPPALAVVAVTGRMGRRGPALALGAALAAPLVEWLLERPDDLGPWRWLGLRLADDFAYQSGLWTGVIRCRSAAALLPESRWSKGRPGWLATVLRAISSVRLPAPAVRYRPPGWRAGDPGRQPRDGRATEPGSSTPRRRPAHR